MLIDEPRESEKLDGASEPLVLNPMVRFLLTAQIVVFAFIAYKIVWREFIRPLVDPSRDHIEPWLPWAALAFLGWGIFAALAMLRRRWWGNVLQVPVVLVIFAYLLDSLRDQRYYFPYGQELSNVFIAVWAMTTCWHLIKEARAMFRQSSNEPARHRFLWIAFAILCLPAAAVQLYLAYAEGLSDGMRILVGITFIMMSILVLGHYRRLDSKRTMRIPPND